MTCWITSESDKPNESLIVIEFFQPCFFRLESITEIICVMLLNLQGVG